MIRRLWNDTSSIVALRKESVDRNVWAYMKILVVVASLSARRAWIEIFYAPQAPTQRAVALRKESVDRNPNGGK